MIRYGHNPHHLARRHDRKRARWHRMTEGGVGPRGHQPELYAQVRRPGNDPNDRRLLRALMGRCGSRVTRPGPRRGRRSHARGDERGVPPDSRRVRNPECLTPPQQCPASSPMRDAVATLISFQIAFSWLSECHHIFDVARQLTLRGHSSVVQGITQSPGSEGVPSVLVRATSPAGATLQTVWLLLPSLAHLTIHWLSRCPTTAVLTAALTIVLVTYWV